MFKSYEFTYAGMPASMFGMYIADMSSNKHSANSFGNKANLVETRLANRVAPIHYGVRYNDTIDFVGGSTQELVFHTFFSQNKKPFDLSSCTASFALINFVNKNGSPLIAKPMEVSKSEDGDGTVTNVLRVVLLPEETVDLVGKFIYQITIQDISGEIEIPDQGIIRIANNINKSFPH